MPATPSDTTILKRLVRQIPSWPQKTADKARRRRYNQHKQLVFLDLSHLGLTVLPPELTALRHLRELNLAGNQLTVLPAELGQLKALQVLDLAGNQLRELPAVLSQLAQLRELNLNENQLTALPAESGQLSRLHTLTQGNNPSVQQRPPKVIQVLVRPTPLGFVGGWLWVQIIDDQPVTMIWTPETPEELEEAERFARAIEAIDWSVSGIHEVQY